MSKEIVGGICNDLMADGLRDIALSVFTGFSTHGRPGEIRRLKRKHLLVPVAERGALGQWAISIAPQEDDPMAVRQLTKTGTMDDSIALDSPDWLGPLLSYHSSGRASDSPIFLTHAAAAVDAFEKAGEAICRVRSRGRAWGVVDCC